MQRVCYIKVIQHYVLAIYSLLDIMNCIDYVRGGSDTARNSGHGQDKIKCERYINKCNKPYTSRNSCVGSTTANSPEYDEYRLFLNVMTISREISPYLPFPVV